MYIHTVEDYSATRKKKSLLFVTTWMDLEGNKLKETIQTEKEISKAYKSLTTRVFITGGFSFLSQKVLLSPHNRSASTLTFCHLDWGASTPYIVISTEAKRNGEISMRFLDYARNDKVSTNPS